MAKTTARPYRIVGHKGGVPIKRFRPGFSLNRKQTLVSVAQLNRGQLPEAKDMILGARRKLMLRRKTKAERLLNNWLRAGAKKDATFRYRSQFVCGPYIMDFYFPDCRLCVELDGSTHNSPAAREYDARRTKFLGENRIRVIRFSNKQVYDDPLRVARAVWREVLITWARNKQQWNRGGEKFDSSSRLPAQ